MSNPNIPQINISFSDRSIRVSRGVLEDLIRFVARAEGVRLGRIDLSIVGKDDIATANREFLRHAGPTDVISFDLSNSHVRGICAQLIVCGEVAAEQAPLHGMTKRDELMLYVIHGLLHVIGYDDLAIRPAAKMHARQDELLSKFRRKHARSIK
ncbi:MAG: rRNA maturation RNase YbeY [Planctomycetaceae bacterium]|nr:MAG: rRNA maturation RNase YbeY [Planctomycetaceae bacterium]